jgi:glycosyltransferase involved in cell wall biosynthesis
MAAAKRVMLIIPNLDFGGAQTSLARITWLLKPFCQLMIVPFNKEKMAPISYGADITDLNVFASNSYFGKSINFIKRVYRLRKLKLKFNPDVSISFLEGADYVNLLSSINEQIFFYIHGSKLYDRNILGLLGLVRKRILIPLFYKRADKILVVNSRIADELKTSYKMTSQLFEEFPNFYDFDSIRKLAAEPLESSLTIFFQQHKIMCISGRISPEKGIDKFATILPSLFKKHPDSRLILVGDGPDTDLVKNVLKSYSIIFKSVDSNTDEIEEDVKVLFLGYQKNPYKYLGRSQLLLLPSLNEGMPNTLVEAMGLGIPVLAADCPYGPRELMGSEKKDSNWPEFAPYGVLAPVLLDTSVNHFWLEALDTLLTDDALRLKNKESGILRSQDFSHEKMVIKWRGLLHV